MAKSRSQKYGRFSDDGREYIITRPDTPRPWINYLHNGSYVAIISQTAGGYSFLTDAYYNRLTRWRWGVLPDGLPADEPGRYVYIRDERTGKFWSATYAPVRKKPDEFECRHSPGVTTITSSTYGIRTSIRYFVALDDAVEIWLVSLKNESGKKRRISTWPYVEWCLGRGSLDTETYSGLLFNRVWKKGNCIIGTKALPRLWATAENPMGLKDAPTWYFGFVSSSAKIGEFELDRNTFLGRHRHLDSPQALAGGALSSQRELIGRDSCAVFKHTHTLSAGQEKSFVVVLGLCDKESDVQRVAAKYRSLSGAKKELNRVGRHWDGFLNRLTVSTPDKEFDILANTWLKHQARTCAYANRAINYYHCGFSWSGFRDTCQDLLAMAPQEPKMVRDLLKTLCYCQFREGDVVHYRRPYTMEGPWTGHVDSLLWFPMALAKYVKETGDWAILNEKSGYKDGGKDSLLEHAVRTIEYTFKKNIGRRGVPLINRGDWNDALNSVGDEGRGESFWMAPFIYHVLSDFLPILRKRRPSLAAKYSRKLKMLREAFNRHGWDGAWFKRATCDDGRVIGSAKCAEGKIFMMPQVWAVMSGITTPERERRALESVRRRLYTSKGPVNLAPPFTRLDYDGVGIITCFPPNIKENGSIFLHSACWLMVALAKMGLGGEAYKIFNQVSPIANAREPDLYLTEPYVTAEILLGPGCPKPYRLGEGQQTWLTGSGAWMWMVAVEWLLGIRAEWDGLRIDPAIPPKWKGYKVKKPWRGNVYDITVTNPAGVASGIMELIVDGRKIAGNVIPPPRGRGRTISVKAVMGKVSK